MTGYTQIKETCLYVPDLDRARYFYHELLGFPLISQVDGRHVFFRVGSSVLLCFIPETTREESTLPPHYARGKQHIAFEVEAEEYESKKLELKEKGIVATQVQSWKDGLESFYFEDPFGHVLEVVPKGIWE